MFFVFVCSNVCYYVVSFSSRYNSLPVERKCNFHGKKEKKNRCGKSDRNFLPKTLLQTCKSHRIVFCTSQTQQMSTANWWRFYLLLFWCIFSDDAFAASLVQWIEINSERACLFFHRQMHIHKKKLIYSEKATYLDLFWLYF